MNRTKLMTTMAYILFLAQEANFQTRSILIPAREFLLVRNDEYTELCQASQKNHVIQLRNGTEVTIDNFLTSKFFRESENCYIQEKTKVSKISNLLIPHGVDELSDTKDLEWYNKSRINRFNHLENYQNCKKLMNLPGLNNINIFNSFLQLDKFVDLKRTA